MNPMANMNPMGGPVGGAPVPMMNNGAVNPQIANAANAGPAAAPRQQQINDQRGIFNTYIYEYFIRYGMYDCARSLLSSEQPVYVDRDATPARRRDENGNVINGAVDDPMDTDSKEDLDSKLPDGLPPPKLPMPTSDSFLYEWFCIFWDIFHAQRGKGGSNIANQYVAHTQQQSRLNQTQQHELLRQMRPDLTTQQYQASLMRSMQNGNMPMGMKQGNLARAAMANNQHNPQMQMLQQQAKQNQMQRDPSGMDANRDRPSSPASGDNAPSPSKRQRIDGAQFNPNQPGAMMANGRPAQGMPGQQMAGNPNAVAAQQMLTANGINPNSLNAQQFQHFVSMPPAAQQKSIQTYSQNLQQHQGTQMNTKAMPNAPGPQNQGSPMMPPNTDASALATFYNPGDMNGPGGLRPGPGGAQGGQGGSNHALQDYQMQLMLLEQQNKKRLMMARQEQDSMGGIPRDGAGPGAPGAPGAPQGPNGQPFPDASPQAMRTGTSPNPTDQMKRGTPQMNNSGIPSPVPEGGQSRGSPNPAINFMANHVDPNMAPHFFKGMETSMAAAQAQMNGMRAPSSHPGQPFNNQMTQQQMMAARQQQGQQGQQPGQPGQPGQGNPQQWQQGPNGQMMPQGMQQNQQVQGTPQQRAMPPPSAPAAAGANASRTTASPQQAAAAPPTPNQSNKAGPKKNDKKKTTDKRAAQKKSNSNLNAGATPSGDNSGEPEAPTPATPITPVNAASFNKNGQNGPSAPNGQANAGGAGAAPAPTAVPSAAAPNASTAQLPPQGHGDPNQNGGITMDNFSGIDFPSMELANPLQTGDVLNDFDFDSFLHDDNGGAEPFDFNGAFASMEGNEIGAE